MNSAVPALVAVLVISALSLTGAAVLVLGQAALRRSLLVLISFAAGALLGDAFLHLLPETIEADGAMTIGTSLAILGGVVGFFILEKVLHWHHAHVPTEDVIHPVAVTNLVGDGLHNLIDGALVAASFLVSPSLGLATAIAVALHEIPQEMGDFAILLHANLKPRRALLLNALSGLLAVAGAVIALVASGVVEGLERVLVPATAGGFVYIASTDLLPELRKEPEAAKSLLQVAALLAGIGVMAALLLVE